MLSVWPEQGGGPPSSQKEKRRRLKVIGTRDRVVQGPPSSLIRGKGVKGAEAQVVHPPQPCLTHTISNAGERHARAPGGSGAVPREAGRESELRGVPRPGAGALQLSGCLWASRDLR